MGSRILLADDSITIQKVVNLTFTDEGFDVVSVSNGDQAVRMMAEVDPDLVLADIFMPGKNGYELCEAIKQSSQFHHIPVVLLVGAFEPFDQVEAKRVRADAHLTKPFESRALVDTVRNLLHTTARPRSGPVPPLPPPESRYRPEAETPPTAHFVPPPPPVPVPLPVQEATRLTGATTSEFALSETTPLDISITGLESPHSSLPPEAQFLPIEMFDADPPAAAGSHNTDELSFSGSNDAPPFQMLNYEAVAADNDGVHLPLASTDTVPAFVSTESDHGAQSSDFSFGEDVVLDTNSSDVMEVTDVESSITFAVDKPEALAVDLGEPRDESADQSLDDETESLRTTLLVAPRQVSLQDEPSDTNPLEMPAMATSSHLRDFDLSAMPSADDAAVLSADEPLGNVLEDVSHPPHESLLETGSEQASSVSAFGFEISSPPSLESQAVLDPSTPVEDALVFEPEATNAAQRTDELEAAGSEAQELLEASASPLENEAPQERAATPAEWADSAPPETAFDVVQADDVEHAHSEDEEPTGAARNGKYPTSTMWTNGDAHFTAIDIEAMPVEENEFATIPGAAQPATGELTFAPVESGEDEAVAPPVEAHAESPAPSQTAAAVSEVREPSVAPQAQVSEPASASGLAPALIEDIVRRVVAQMSETVVREIAWEVVPDVVERIIKEMTQSELVKRM